LEIGDGFAKIKHRLAGMRLIQRILLEDGYVIAPITNELMENAIRLYQLRADKEFGLTDCLSFILMRQEGLDAALTADRHFQQEGFRALLLE
jgi:predicted nucleic acid-binding protein